MPQGDKRGSTYEFYDWNYDGEWKGENLLNGLGSLTDSNLGPADYKLGYYAKSKQIYFQLLGILITDGSLLQIVDGLVGKMKRGTLWK